MAIDYLTKYVKAKASMKNDAQPTTSSYANMSLHDTKPLSRLLTNRECISLRNVSPSC